ncbi:NERD domain-containing protein [Nocardia mikamii]|uniref:NERD domain-containing protein n=1 Tax=Nocardia mikamii TaxID=508464 RepID=UPI000A00D13A
MLIINGDITKPKTQQQVVEWLANYVTQPGIAVSGVYIPRLDGGSTEADLLVFTPHAAAVIEVDALRKKTRGPLSYSMNERWSAPGIHGDPVQRRSDDLNPLHQVRRPVSALRTFVAELTRGPEPFVDGLILLIPKSGNTVTLDKGPMPGGFTVLLGDSASQLYSWFGRTAQHRDRTPWTAELVVTVLTALRVDRTRDAESRRRLYADLVAEGFPTEVPTARRDGDTDPAASSPASANPPAPPTSASAFTSSEKPAPRTSAEPVSSTSPVSYARPHPSISSSSPASDAGPLLTTASTSHAKPTPSSTRTSRAVPDDASTQALHPEETSAAAPGPAPRVGPTPAAASTSDSTPAPTGAEAPTTQPTKSAPIPPSAPPRRTDEPTRTPSPSDTVVPSTPITSPQADAPEPDRHEPGPDFANFDPRAQPPANHRLRTALLGIAAALILICGIGYLAGKDHPRAQSGSQPAPSQVRPPERTTTPIPASPVAPTDRQGTAPRSATPTEGATCYPFQAGC